MLDRAGPRLVIQTGLAAMIVGLVLFALSPLTVTTFYTAGVAIGLGLSALLGAPLRYVTLQEAGDERRGAGQGLLTLFLSIGQLLGAAMIGGVVASSANELGGYKNALFTVAVFCSIALLLSAALRRAERTGHGVEHRRMRLAAAHRGIIAAASRQLQKGSGACATVGLHRPFCPPTSLALGEEVEAVLAAGADLVHFDVMDNHYVPNLTIGPLVCQALRDYGIQAPIDVHLMVKPVDRIIPDFAAAGATFISIHPEATEHVDRSLQLIREHGCKSGLVFNPATPLSWLDHVLDKVDLVLLMSVNPGFGGTEVHRSHIAEANAGARHHRSFGACDSARGRWRRENGQHRADRRGGRRHVRRWLCDLRLTGLSCDDRRDASRNRALKRSRACTQAARTVVRAVLGTRFPRAVLLCSRPPKTSQSPIVDV